MTGVWEKRLQNIAYGQEFSMPSATQLVGSMQDLSLLLDKAAAEPGVQGESGEAATQSLHSASQRARAVAATTQKVQASLDQANQVRLDAQQNLAGLSSGTLSPRDEAIVRAAAAGATIMFPGFSVIAGEGAVDLINWFLGHNREDAAKQAVQAASARLDQIDFPQELEAPDGEGTKDAGGKHPVLSPGVGGPGIGGPGVGGPGIGAPGIGGPGTGEGGSFGNYPDADTPVFDHGNLPGGLTVDDSYPGPEFAVDPPSGSDGDSLNPVVVPPGHKPPWTGDWNGGGLTPNGPATGGTSWGTVPGGTGLGSAPSTVGAGSGSGSGMLGSAATGGAVAGTSGAALFGGARLARGGAAGSVAPGAVAGGGMGTRGAAGAGRSGGLLGGTRAGAAASGKGAGAASGSGAGGRGGMVGGGGRPAGGGRGRDKQEAHGLGGPIAPHLEDDEDRGPRSESAGAGGRD